MSKEAMNNEEKEAVKELIEKIPPEDLEKAVGGMDKHTVKLLKNAGLLALVAAASGYAGYKFKKPEMIYVDKVRSIGDLSTNKSDFYESEFTQKFGYVYTKEEVLKKEYGKWDGMIFKKSEMHEEDGKLVPNKDAVILAFDKNLEWPKT